MTNSLMTMTAIEPINKPEPLVPSDIRLIFGAPDPTSFYYLTRLDRWSPFVAASLLMGLVPKEPTSPTEVTVATWEVDPDNEEASLEHFESGFMHTSELTELTKVIAQNASGQGEKDVSPEEIVAWAISTQTISPDCEIARVFERRRLATPVPATDPASTTTANAHEKLVDDLKSANEEIARLTVERDDFKKKAKNTGKQFIEQRATILAAALHRLANGRDECIDSNQRVVGAKLVGQVNDKRVFYGFTDDDSDPSYATIEQHITSALSDIAWRKKARKFSHP